MNKKDQNLMCKLMCYVDGKKSQMKMGDARECLTNLVEADAVVFAKYAKAPFGDKYMKAVWARAKEINKAKARLEKKAKGRK